MGKDGSVFAIPWLDRPVLLHSSRKELCKLTKAQCEYRHGHWRDWYQADHVYALATVYFMCATIGVFTIFRFASRLSDSRTKSKSPLGRWTSIPRYAEYKTFRFMGWVTPTLGILLLIVAGSAFLFGLSLGPQPYYWPSIKTSSYGGSPPLATRTGWMAVALLPFVVALSSKQNYITSLTGVPHEKLQLYHQVCSWAMFVLALAHTFPFIIMHIKKGDMMKQWSTSFTYWTGVAAIIPQGWLTLMSLGPIRNRYYEFFKTTHRLAALSFVGFFFIHCDYRLTSWDYFIATGALYLTPLVYSQLRTYFQYGFFHRARLTLLEGNMLKISGPIFQSNAKPLNISWTPGQHIFIRFPSLGLHGLTSHPFIISCLPPSHSKNTVAKAEDTELIFYLKPMKGITARLAALASKAPNITVPILLDGPYGGLTIKTFAKFDRVLLIAGGAGAGFTLPLIEDILRHQHTTSPSQRLTKIHVIISTKHTAIKDWYQKELDYLRRYIAPSPTDPDNDGAEDILTSSIYVSSIEPPQRIIVSPYPVSTTSAGQLYNWPSDFQKVWSHRCPTSINEYQNSKMPIEERADDEERVNFIRSNSMRSNSMRRAYTASPTYGRRGTQSAAGTYSTTTDRESYCTRATHNNNNNNKNNSNNNNSNNLTYIISTQTTLPQKTQSPLSGRPDLKALVRDLTAGQGESVGIAVCGPAGMCFDVKNAAAEAQVRVLRGEGAREVYLHSEIFG